MGRGLAVYDSEPERGPKTAKKRQGTGKRPCMTVAGRLPCRLGAPRALSTQQGVHYLLLPYRELYVLWRYNYGEK